MAYLLLRLIRSVNCTSKLRSPIKILISTSSEVNIYCFLLVTFARLGILFISFSESVASTSVPAKQLPTLIPDIGISHPSSVSLCFYPLCYLLTLSLCLRKATKSGIQCGHWSGVPLASASSARLVCALPSCL